MYVRSHDDTSTEHVEYSVVYRPARFSNLISDVNIAPKGLENVFVI
jgi:hypothetical protein